MNPTVFFNLFNNSYSSIRSEKIHGLSAKLGLDFQEAATALSLPRSWTLDKATELEIKKSLIRSQLRYSSSGIRFASESAKVLALQYSKAQINFHTLIYPMIHLAGDLAEVGGFHTDQVGKIKLRTGWTAITEYKYAPLSFVPFGLLGDAMSRRLFRYSLPQRIGFSINAQRGDILTWGGGFYHRGNQNISEEISCAAVIRASDTPLYLEPSRSIKTLVLLSRTTYRIGGHKNYKSR